MMRTWRVRGVSRIRRIPGIYEKGPKDIKPCRELRRTVLGISDKIFPGPGSAKFFFIVWTPTEYQLYLVISSDFFHFAL
jgi:hypothetical protein